MTKFKTPKRHLIYYEDFNIYEEVWTANIQPYIDSKADGDVIDVTGVYEHEINATGAPF